MRRAAADCRLTCECRAELGNGESPLRNQHARNAAGIVHWPAAMEKMKARRRRKIIGSA